MKSQKVTIYIRVCGEPGRPFKKVLVRNPRQCGARDSTRCTPRTIFVRAPSRTSAPSWSDVRCDCTADGCVPVPRALRFRSRLWVCGGSHAEAQRLLALELPSQSCVQIRPRWVVLGEELPTAVDAQAVIDRCPAQRLEDVTRQHLIEFREWFREEGYEEWTTKTNLTTVVTFLKHNPVKSVVGLLKPEDWPVIEDTEPEPYTVEEVFALQSVATDFERLLIRFFIGTGCRDMEVATLEWDDIDFVRKTVRIHKKALTEFGLWKPKTRAGTRTIPISDALCRDLKAAKAKSTNTLVFPAPLGSVDRHFLRIVQGLAKQVGIHGAKLHRFRDTLCPRFTRVYPSLPRLCPLLLRIERGIRDIEWDWIAGRTANSTRNAKPTACITTIIAFRGLSKARLRVDFWRDARAKSFESNYPCPNLR